MTLHIIVSLKIIVHCIPLCLVNCSLHSIMSSSCSYSLVLWGGYSLHPVQLSHDAIVIPASLGRLSLLLEVPVKRWDSILVACGISTKMISYGLLTTHCMTSSSPPLCLIYIFSLFLSIQVWLDRCCSFLGKCHFKIYCVLISYYSVKVRDKTLC